MKKLYYWNTIRMSVNDFTNLVEDVAEFSTGSHELFPYNITVVDVTSDEETEYEREDFIDKFLGDIITKYYFDFYRNKLYVTFQ